MSVTSCTTTRNCTIRHTILQPLLCKIALESRPVSLTEAHFCTFKACIGSSGAQVGNPLSLHQNSHDYILYCWVVGGTCLVTIMPACKLGLGAVSSAADSQKMWLALIMQSCCLSELDIRADSRLPQARLQASTMHDTHLYYMHLLIKR